MIGERPKQPATTQRFVSHQCKAGVVTGDVAWGLLQHAKAHGVEPQRSPNSPSHILRHPGSGSFDFVPIWMMRVSVACIYVSM